MQRYLLIFTQQLQQGSQNPVVTNTKVTVNRATIKITPDSTPSKEHQKKLTEAINGTTGTTFLSQLDGYLGKLQKYMNDNCKKESLSKLFPKTTFEYKNGNDVIKFDMSTQKFEYSDQKVLMNGLNGTVLNLTNNECFQTDSLERQ